jgi:hypothetical protein
MHNLFDLKVYGHINSQGIFASLYFKLPARRDGLNSFYYALPQHLLLSLPGSRVA